MGLEKRNLDWYWRYLWCTHVSLPISLLPHVQFILAKLRARALHYTATISWQVAKAKARKRDAIHDKVCCCHHLKTMHVANQILLDLPVVEDI